MGNCKIDPCTGIIHSAFAAGRKQDKEENKAAEEYWFHRLFDFGTLNWFNG
jgi:hypothetical protein